MTYRARKRQGYDAYGNPAFVRRLDFWVTWALRAFCVALAVIVALAVVSRL